MKFIKSQAGYTLIELIVTMTILLIVVIPLGSFFLTATQNNTKSNVQHRANLMAVQYMENQKSSGLIQRDSHGDPIQIHHTAEDLTVVLTATPVTNTMEASASTEPKVPVTPSLTGLYVVPDPILSEVKDYSRPKGDAETAVPSAQIGPNGAVTATYTLTDIDDGAAQGIIYDESMPPIKSNQVTITETQNLLTVACGSELKTPTITSVPVNIVFNVASNKAFSISFGSNSYDPINIYLVRGIDSTGNPYDDSKVSIGSRPLNVNVYKNILRRPLTADLHRLYKVTVDVYKSTDVTTLPDSSVEPKSGAKSLSTLISYVKTK